MLTLHGRRILLCVSGSIAAYKAAELASRLTQAGSVIDVVMTESASRFVGALTFSSLTGRPAYQDMFDQASDCPELHVELGRQAEVVVIAPATATTIARLAHGMADDLASLAALASRSPLVVAPAMDSLMWESPATRANIAILSGQGAIIVGPCEGRLASGHIGLGRLADTEAILGATRLALGRHGDLEGRKLVVSAGGTKEPIDPVRYVGNYSSGKMGHALAEAARDRGAEVVLVTASSLGKPYGVKTVRVVRAEEMRRAVVGECHGADAVLMAAAVADYRPAVEVQEKMKRAQEERLVLELERTPDVLGDVGKVRSLIKVGFAAESQDLLTNAQEKLRTKRLDLLAANDVTEKGAGFGSDTNRILLLDSGGGQEELPMLSKYDAAQRILDRVVSLLRK